MWSWLARRMLSGDLEKLRGGDPGPLLKMDAPDVRFRFPGETSWSGEIRGKAALAEWLGRFVDVGIQLFADEIVLQGPPWRTQLCIRGTDRLCDDAGTVVYDNRFVIWGTLRWGRVVEYEVYEDTQKSAALDAYLAAGA